MCTSVNIPRKITKKEIATKVKRQGISMISSTANTPVNTAPSNQHRKRDNTKKSVKDRKE